jgi:ERCC4-type nuclease
VHSGDNTKKISIQIIQKQLPIGDIILCSDDGKEQVLIERKTLADMASSILDGRYKEQSMRLNACNVNNHNIIYLIEGVMNNYFSTRLERKSLLSSLVSIMHYKGFSIYKTNNIQESSEWIVQMARKISKDQSIGNAPYFKNADQVQDLSGNDVKDKDKDKDDDEQGINNNSISSTETDEKYSSVIKRVKKDNITPDNIGEIMLSQIPSVSVLNAQTIMKQFKTIKNLIHELTEKGESVLSNIKQNNRRISKTCVSNIYKYLIL